MRGGAHERGGGDERDVQGVTHAGTLGERERGRGKGRGRGKDIKIRKSGAVAGKESDDAKEARGKRGDGVGGGSSVPLSGRSSGTEMHPERKTATREEEKKNSQRRAKGKQACGGKRRGRVPCFTVRVQRMSVDIRNADAKVR